LPLLGISSWSAAEDSLYFLCSSKRTSCI
jgi:hypothetical protein